MLYSCSHMVAVSVGLTESAGDQCSNAYACVAGVRDVSRHTFVYY